MYQMWQGCSSYVRTHGPRVAPDLGSRCVVGEGRGEAATRIPTKAAAPALDSNANRLREVWHDLCVWFVTRSTFRSDFAFTMPDTTDRSRCDFLFCTFCARIQTSAALKRPRIESLSRVEGCFTVCALRREAGVRPFPYPPAPVFCEASPIRQPTSPCSAK